MATPSSGTPMTPSATPPGAAAGVALRASARDLVLRLASGDIRPDEMAALKGWLAAAPAHQAAFAAERAVWRGLEPLRTSLARSLEPTSEPATPARRPASIAPRRRRVRRGLAVAVLVAAVSGGVVAQQDLLMRWRADHVTPVGEVARFTLPDGSIVLLNTDSALAVHYSAAERRVDLLRGEGWFSVRKDATRPFRVHAQDGYAEAVGTAFDVRRDDDVTVSVSTGVVAVTAPQSATATQPQTVQVNAGMQTAYTPGRGPGGPSAFDDAVVLGWRHRRIVIDDMPLAQALAELNRYRSGRIILLNGSRAETRVSGVFAVGDLDRGLSGLAATQGLRVLHLTPYLVFLQ